MKILDVFTLKSHRTVLLISTAECNLMAGDRLVVTNPDGSEVSAVVVDIDRMKTECAAGSYSSEPAMTGVLVELHGDVVTGAVIRLAEE
jgi:hypothetical protein